MTRKQKKPWGGRFRQATHTLVEQFTSSLHFDRRLYRYDIEGSIAHVKMLARQKIVSKKEERLIVSGLKDILKDMDTGHFEFRHEDEDIHMAIEKALIERIGETGGKLHTGRSRNDQIALDMRLYLRSELEQILKRLASVKDTLVALAEKEQDTLFPGYTHLQKAQPVLFSHYLLAYWEMLARDEQRLRECYERVNVMPLGSAALAGTGLPIDREYTARTLGFPRISHNSMDAVSDRDFIIEFISAASLLMMHLSRFCEDLILWSTEEFGFVALPDAFTTGSSIMPQKKNPDVLELIRGKTGRVYGNLISLLTIMKALPMTYNRDLQEDKEPLFDSVDTVKACLEVFGELLKNITFNRERMSTSAQSGFTTATDVAEYLVMRGVPFREAHEIVGRLVSYCIERKKDLMDLTLNELRTFHSKFEKDVFACMRAEYSVNAKRSPGGTAKELILRRIRDIKEGKA